MTLSVVETKHTAVPTGAAAAAAPTAPWKVDVAFGALCLMVAGVRFGVLVAGGAPSGIDGGNWLAFGHGLLGDATRSSSLVYPPVVPLVTTGAVGLFGPVAGIAAVASLSSLVPAVAVYVMLRSRISAVPAGLLAGLLAAAASTAEPAAWGGYPQLMGAGAALLGLWLLDRSLRTGRAGDRLGSGTLLALTLATSHFVAAVAAVAALVVISVHLATADDRRWAMLRSLLLVALPCLPLVPLYVAMAEVLSGFGDRHDVLRMDATDLVPELAYVFRDLPWLWWSGLVVAIACLLVLVDRRQHPLWLLPASLMAALTVLVAFTREPRFLYLAPIAVVLALGLLYDEVVAWVPGLRRWLPLLLGVALAYQSIAGLALFPAQRRSYAVLDPGVVAGIDWLTENAPAGSVVAVTPVRDSPLGWWVEGLGRRPTLPAAALRWLHFEDERARARVANQIFEAGFVRQFPNDASLERAARSGASHLLVAKAWAGYAASPTERFRRAHPQAFVFENQSVVILRVPRRSEAP